VERSSVYSTDASFIFALIELAIDTESYVVYAVKEEEKNVIETKEDDSKLKLLKMYRGKLGEFLHETARPILERWRDDCATMEREYNRETSEPTEKSQSSQNDISKSQNNKKDKNKEEKKGDKKRHERRQKKR